MGSRWCACCLAAVAFASPPAFAEDIGREPLAPMPPPAPANDPSRSATTVPAAQAPPAADRSPSGSPTRRWYGWQPLVIDGVLLVGLVAVASNQRHSDSDNFLIPF